MQRFVAFAWDCRVGALRNRTDALAVQLKSEQPDFRRALSVDGLQVYRAGDGSGSCDTCLFANNHGLAVGKLFRRAIEVSPETLVSDIGASESRRIAKSAGRRIVDEYWGRYVAFVIDRSLDAVHVLRDPTGAMPCHHVNLSGIHLFFSHVSDCRPFNLHDRPINWDHIVRFLLFHRLVTPETGLVGISHLRAGECMTLANGRLRSRFYWSPARVCSDQVVDDPAEAGRQLSSCIKGCVTAWSSRYESILHRLSGGLDSAVVLACLANGKSLPGLIAHNHFAPGSEGDERRFARAAARRVNVKLHETLLVPSDRPFEKAIATAPAVCPTLTQLTLEETQSRDELVRRHAVEAVFSGQGGDHLFQRTATRQIAVEYATRNGLQSGFLTVAADTARFTNKSFWSVIAAVIAGTTFRRRFDPYADRITISPFLCEAFRDAVDVGHVRHPWVCDAKHLPSAKLLQITDIIDTQNLHNVSYPQADAIHPLLSQPLIELCLQIPTYILTYDGRDRALIRDAFKFQLPEEIYLRSAKGGTTRYVYNYLLANLSPIRALLLDGALSGNGILDRGATESCLTESRLVRDSALLFPILSFLRVEAWLAAWKRAEPQGVT